MPVAKPPTLTLYYTRGTTYVEEFGFPGWGADIDTMSATMTIKRRDRQSSPVLLTLTGSLALDDDDATLVRAAFSATPDQTVALPAGDLWWTLDLLETGGAVTRYLEGPFKGNE
jgi:hypothetical protein